MESSMQFNEPVGLKLFIIYIAPVFRAAML